MLRELGLIYWSVVQITEGLRFLLLTLVHQFFLLHSPSSSAHPCKRSPGSFRSMRVESSVQHPLRVGGSPLCLHHKET